MKEFLASAYSWLIHGYGVLPTQPGSKRLITGFGVNVRVLTETEQMRFWFEDRNASITVCCLQPDQVILDFDDPGVYQSWATDHPDAALAYTERTPGDGFHVWLRYTLARPVARILPVAGLELKKAAVVYPSHVAEKPYQVIGGKMLTVNLESALAGYAQFLATAATAQPIRKQIQGGLLDRAKAAWPLLPYLAQYEPKLNLIGGGRWLRARCPWHDDRVPSLWIDSVRNLWGCHGCPAHGDVINWHALRTGKSITDAARDLLPLSAEGEHV